MDPLVAPGGDSSGTLQAASLLGRGASGDHRAYVAGRRVGPCWRDRESVRGLRGACIRSSPGIRQFLRHPNSNSACGCIVMRDGRLARPVRQAGAPRIHQLATAVWISRRSTPPGRAAMQHRTPPTGWVRCHPECIELFTLGAACLSLLPAPRTDGVRPINCTAQLPPPDRSGCRSPRRRPRLGQGECSSTDISNDFFKLWQDPTQTTTARLLRARRPDARDAQMAIDLALGKLASTRDDAARHRLRLGFDDHARRGRYDVNVIGLTLSENQRRHIEEHWFANSKSPRHKGFGCESHGRVRRQRWTGSSRSAPSSTSASTVTTTTSRRRSAGCPTTGVMLLHDHRSRGRGSEGQGLPLKCPRCSFIKFIAGRIIPAVLAAAGLDKSNSTPPRPASTSPTRAAPAAATCAPWTPLGGQPGGQRRTRPSRSPMTRSTRGSTGTLTGCADLFRAGSPMSASSPAKAIQLEADAHGGDDAAGVRGRSSFAYDMATGSSGLFQDPAGPTAARALSART